MYWILDNSGLEVVTCLLAQATNQPYYGGLLECGGSWTLVARLHAPTIALFNLQALITEDRFEKEERLVGGPGHEKMRVASWHIRTLPHKIPSTVGWVVLTHT